MTQQNLNSQLHIGVDLDDTFWGLAIEALNFLNHRYQKQITFDELVSFKVTEVFGLQKEEADACFDEFYRDHHHRLRPLPGAIESLGRIKAVDRLSSITARRLVERDRTISHLTGLGADHLFETVHFTDEQSKAPICQSEQINVLIDDGHHNAVDVSQTGTTVLLMDRPWNRLLDLPDNTYRVHSWLEIEEVLGDLRT